MTAITRKEALRNFFNGFKVYQIRSSFIPIEKQMSNILDTPRQLFLGRKQEASYENMGVLVGVGLDGMAACSLSFYVYDSPIRNLVWVGGTWLGTKLATNVLSPLAYKCLYSILDAPGRDMALGE